MEQKKSFAIILSSLIIVLFILSFVAYLNGNILDKTMIWSDLIDC